VVSTRGRASAITFEYATAPPDRSLSCETNGQDLSLFFWNFLAQGTPLLSSYSSRRIDESATPRKLGALSFPSPPFPSPLVCGRLCADCGIRDFPHAQTNSLFPCLMPLSYQPFLLQNPVCALIPARKGVTPQPVPVSSTYGVGGYFSFGSGVHGPSRDGKVGFFWGDLSFFQSVVLLRIVFFEALFTGWPSLCSGLTLPPSCKAASFMGVSFLRLSFCPSCFVDTFFQLKVC